MKKRLLALLLALCIAVGTGIIAAPAVAEAIKVYVIENTLPVYNRVSGRTVLLGTMSYGEEMSCVAVNKDWACVKNAAGAVGYCKTEGLTNIDPNKYSVKVYAKADGVKVYDKPDSASAVLKTLPLNASYTGVAITPDSKWIRLKNGSSYGYALASQLSKEPVQVHGALTGEPVYVISNTLPVYASASTSAKKLGTMAYGESMRLLGTSGDWAKVLNTSGSTGYCKSENLSFESPDVLNMEVYALENGVKVYKKPSTSFGVLKTAAQNERFNAVSITLDGKWLRVKNGTAYGYVKTEDVSAEASVSGDVYVCDNTLPVYAIADAASEKLGTMAYGEKLVLLSVNGSWAEVRNDAGVTGYCDISGLTYQNLNILSLKVYAVEDGVQVYSKPDTAFTVIKTANKNDSFTAVAVTIDELWLRVQTGSGYGYILAEDLSIEKTETGAGMMVYVSANILPVYQSASTSAKVLGSMAYGEALLLHDQNGTWAKVQNEKGEIGYCSAAGLTIENPNNINKTGYVSQNGVKVYKKPDASSGTVMTLNKNSAVTVLAVTQDSKWMRIAAGAAYGYVPSEYIQESEADDFTPITVYVAENLLKVYKSASESSKVMGTMAYGEAMKLTGVNDGWAEVMNTSGEKGYCSYGGLTDVDPNSEGLTMYAQDATPIYKKPSTGYGTVANVGKNAALSVVAITPDGDWARVYIGSSKYGYAQMSKLAQTEVPSGDEFADENFTKKTVYGIATATTCYASPSTSSKSVGNLYFGQSATCTGENGDWARVVNGSGTVAYCKISNISTENPNKYSVAVYAKSAGTKVYQKPSTSSSVIATVGKNGKCTGVAVSTDGKWYRLKNGSTYGYALASDFSTSIIQENDSGASAKIKKVIAVAEKQYGKKYVYGAEGPNTFDCSGLIIYAFKNGAGITSFPRTAEKMGYSNTYPKVSKISDLKVGDLVFFDTSSDNDLCDHVGIYLGGGYFVHASSAAAKVVKSNLNSGYYNRVFSWGRRVLQ